MPYGLRISVEKNLGRNPPAYQGGLQGNHRLYLGEDVAEPIQKLNLLSPKPGRRNHRIIEFMIGHEPGLIAMKERGLVDDAEDLTRRNARLGRHATSEDSVVEIQQNFTQVKNNGPRDS